jgi:hypothetical protein
VQPDAHLRAIAAHLDLGQVPLSVCGGAHRAIGRGEHGHHTVTHALDHVTATVGDRRLDGRRDHPQ